MNRINKLHHFKTELDIIKNLDEGLDFISEYSKVAVPAERCSIFLYDEKNQTLYTKLADGVDEITLPYDQGIVGKTLATGKCIIENEAYDNSEFFFDVDAQTGYYTQNILTAPIFNNAEKIVGVFQLLNKQGGFNKEDVKYISLLAQHISSYITLMSE